MPQASFESNMGYRRKVLNLGVVGERPQDHHQEIQHNGCIAYTDTAETSPVKEFERGQAQAEANFDNGQPDDFRFTKRNRVATQKVNTATTPSFIKDKSQREDNTAHGGGTSQRHLY